jgi:flagellar protein FliO/FliZ
MKMLLALLSAILLLPPSARAALAESAGPDLVGGLAKTFGSLIIVIGIILVLYYLAGRFLKLPQGGAFRYIRVVETRHLAPKKSLLLVEVGGEYLLLSSSGEGVNFIKKVEMLEEIEVVGEGGYATLIPAQLKEKLRSFAGELPAGASSALRTEKMAVLRETA